MVKLRERIFSLSVRFILLVQKVHESRRIDVYIARLPIPLKIICLFFHVRTRIYNFVLNQTAVENSI